MASTLGLSAVAAAFGRFPLRALGSGTYPSLGPGGWASVLAPFAAMLLGLAFGARATLRSARTEEGRARLRRLAAPVAAVLPATPLERRLWVGVALAAGIGEELVFRGFLIGQALMAAPWLGAWGVLAVSSGLFGLAHLYQGARGMVGTTLLGALLGFVYLESGLLLLPIVIHALLDLRILLIPANLVHEPALAARPDPAAHEA
jgi:membrane protease YdiL (CAAX protease family)